MNTPKFKEGDIVEMIHSCNGSIAEKQYTLEKDENGNLKASGGILEGNGNGCSCQSYWKLIKSNNNIMENIKDKFILSLIEEPQKSFRKTGLTDNNDILTEDGTKIFLSWLLHNKYAKEFKEKVVDEMLKENKKEKK